MFTAVSIANAEEPWADPAGSALDAAARTEARDVLLGSGADAPWDEARRVAPGDEAGRFLTFELDRGGWAPVFALRPAVGFAIGDAAPDNADGELEPGDLTVLAHVGAFAYSGPFVLAVAPEVEAAVLGEGEGVRLPTAWAGVESGAFEAGFGRRERWLGPARHGPLLLSTNTIAPWLGTFAAEGRLPGRAARVGRLRAEVGAGVLDRPRDDVEDPGLLLMDFRWLPVPEVEIGATRMSIFGGVGRPTPDIGQLLLPTEPHVEDDPDALLPDQDEIASLDFRVTAPLRRWFGIPVDYVEGWWQYGGEDVIARKIGPIPYPSLAGVGNLYGGEVRVRPVTVSFEYSRLLDDYFRWYVGHRVYHEGFTQDDRVMGNWGGPDSETWWGAVATEGTLKDGLLVRGRLWADRARRVGVVGVLNDHVFTLATEEVTTRVGADGAFYLANGLGLTIGGSYESVTGDDFVPGRKASHFRAFGGITHTFGVRTNSDRGSLDPTGALP